MAPWGLEYLQGIYQLKGYPLILDIALTTAE